MLERYVYQPGAALSDYRQAVDILRSRYPKIKTGWIDLKPHVDEILKDIGSAGIATAELQPVLANFAAYFWRAEYALRYPDYYRGYLPEKAFEHYLAMHLLKPGADDVFIDIASEGSPLPEIATRLYECRSYAQDIMYDEGIHENRIGGDASRMPVPTGFVTKATLTCSLEHFEGDSDTRLFLELQRVLRPGGLVVVIPLYVFREAAVQTDPTYSATLDIRFDANVPIYCAEGWRNRHGRWYSAETLWRRIIEPCSDMSFRVFCLRGTENIHRSIYARFCLIGERL